MKNNDFFNQISLIKLKEKGLNIKNSKPFILNFLRVFQKYNKWISDNSLKNISYLLNTPLSDLESLSTFYSHIYRRKVGKNLIKYCDSIVCYITGFKKIKFALIDLLKINPGETTKDNLFTLIPTCCLGNCDKGPSLMINEDLYSFVKPSELRNIIKNYQ